MKNLKLQMILGVVRHLLTGACGTLVTTGTLSNSNVQIIAGIGCGLIGLIWSLIHKQNISTAIDEAVKDCKFQ